MILSNIIRTIDRVEKHAAVYLLAAITAIMSIQILMRYIFRSPLTWAQELSILLMIYLTYVSADMVYRRKGHIGIDFFVNLFPPAGRMAVGVFVHLLMIIFLIVIALNSLVLLKVQAGHDMAGVLPLSKSFWILPVSLTFPSMVLTTLEFLLKSLQRSTAVDALRQEQR